MGIKYNWLKDEYLADLISRINDYCYLQNVLDVQVFQNFVSDCHLLTDGYVAIIKERVDD